MRHILFFCLFVFSFHLNGQKTKLHILSIGVNDYKNFPDLNFARADAQDMARVLALQVELYDLKTNILLTDKDATKKNVEGTLDSLRKLVAPNDLLIFFFSGHGMIDKLLLHDFDNNNIENTCLGRNYLRDAMDDLGCNYYLWLDACYSGSISRAVKINAQDDAAARLELFCKEMTDAFSQADKEVMIITSCASDQVSLECATCGNGYFTQAFLDVLDNYPFFDSTDMKRKWPDTDQDGVVKASELEGYIRDAVRESTRKRYSVNNNLPQLVRIARISGANQPVFFVGEGGRGEGFKNPRPKTENVSDRDKDGVLDYQDLCPDSSGILRGCPDVDKDGVANKDDKCPNVRGLAELDGCPESDTDEDGIPDHKDKCPEQHGEYRYRGCPGN